VGDANQRESHVLIRWIWLDEPHANGHPVLAPASRDALRAGGDVVIKAPSPDGKGTSVCTYAPLQAHSERFAAIELCESLAAEHNYVRQTIVQAAVATGSLVFLCSLLAAGLGIFFVGRPVRRLVDQARRIGAGDLSLSPLPRGRDEIATLAKEMNTMCMRLTEARTRLEAETATRLATQEQLRHADRLTTVGKLAAGIAHEVGTPLNVITGHAQLIRDEYPQTEAAHQNALIIGKQVHRVAEIIRQLLDFARARPPRKETHDLVAIARHVLALLDPLAQKSGVTLELAVPDGEISAEVDAGQIEQVLTNLVVNGIQAMRSGGALSVAVERGAAVGTGPQEPGEGNWARLRVQDGGVGINPQSLERIFEPFFTTKEVGEGTGLGLSVAHGIIKEHGGWIDVRSEIGSGSCFVVHLPLETE
jgi:signal transduction histidine kinase